MKVGLIVVMFLLPFAVQASFADNLVAAAHERLKSKVTYDGSYIAIPYPNGDVPKNIGVCTDVVIRAYRTIGIDLQQLVHEDMKSAFSAYPSKRMWGLTTTDSNIDHRRVPNLRTFFKRHGEVLKVSKNAADYKPGDLVTWTLGAGLPHIGIVVDKKHGFSGNPMIVHNVGQGPKMDDFLFSFKITGHYRYGPES
ncbi:MAG: DUF1287 domain-containing protein [Psychrosphaera sp.]|nr:DUF1287 domain-containing protein [Psychrosphaera sp.]